MMYIFACMCHHNIAKLRELTSFHYRRELRPILLRMLRSVGVAIRKRCTESLRWKWRREVAGAWFDAERQSGSLGQRSLCKRCS